MLFSAGIILIVFGTLFYRAQMPNGSANIAAIGSFMVAMGGFCVLASIVIFVARIMP